MASSRSRAREHMSRCWWDPANRACKTCIHFERWNGEYGDSCDRGVDLSGHPACPTCNGMGWDPNGMDIGGPCPECDNSPEVRDEVKAGPIIHCDLWQPREEYEPDA
jgi:hypothetical protein